MEAFLRGEVVLDFDVGMVEEAKPGAKVGKFVLLMLHSGLTVDLGEPVEVVAVWCSMRYCSLMRECQNEVSLGKQMLSSMSPSSLIYGLRMESLTSSCAKAEPNACVEVNERARVCGCFDHARSEHCPEVEGVDDGAFQAIQKTRPFTKQLQAVSFDVVAAQLLAESVGVHPSLPLTVKRQQHRDNTSANSVSEYYERVVTLPFLDHVNGQIHSRSEANVASIGGFYAFPTKEKVRNFLVRHSENLLELWYIDPKRNMWEVFCYKSEHSPSTLSELLQKLIG
eukprot:gene994-309_t